MTDIDALRKSLAETTLAMANRCTAPTDLWDEHSDKCLEAADALAQQKAEIERLRKAFDWADRLAETLMVVNAQHGGRHAARLLKDYRDARAALRETDHADTE